MRSNPTLKFAPFGRWDAPSARPLALRSASGIPARGLGGKAQFGAFLGFEFAGIALLLRLWFL